MRDYDPQELRPKEPQLYVQKWIEHGFRVGEKIERTLFMEWCDTITIPPLLKEFLLGDEQKHPQHS